MIVVNTLQFFLSILNDQNLMFKSILIIFISMYSLFSLVMLKQIFLLSEIVSNISFSSGLKILSLVNVLLSVGILIATVITL